MLWHVLTDLLWQHAMCCTANCLLMVNKVLWDYCTGAKSMNQKQPQHGKKSLTLQQCAHAVLSAFQSSKITNHSLRYDFVLQEYWLLMVKQAWRQLHYLIVFARLMPAKQLLTSASSTVGTCCLANGTPCSCYANTVLSCCSNT